jgi:hypothetical protein
VAVTRVGELRPGEAGEASLLDEAGKPMRLSASGWSHF